MSSSPPPKPAGQEEDHAILLSCPSTTVARSSTSWKHDSHRFGPQHALDSGTDAAWKSAPSDGTEPNYYEVIFGRSVEVRDLRIMFQGGFVGVDCTVFTKTTDCQEEWEECEDLFIDAIPCRGTRTRCCCNHARERGVPLCSNQYGSYGTVRNSPRFYPSCQRNAG
mmetsp:Transcript_9127/g.20951  ORF Transcript_9127/g.20951 Transcript_9127/m.20951 type:complete len:166 (-) Transcript_9127:65-562(-)